VEGAAAPRPPDHQRRREDHRGSGDRPAHGRLRTGRRRPAPSTLLRRRNQVHRHAEPTNGQRRDSRSAHLRQGPRASSRNQSRRGPRHDPTTPRPDRRRDRRQDRAVRCPSPTRGHRAADARLDPIRHSPGRHRPVPTHSDLTPGQPRYGKRTRAKTAQVLTKATWEPILDEETWQQVGDVLDERKKARNFYEGGSKRIFPFSGLIRCSKCGRAMVHRGEVLHQCQSMNKGDCTRSIRSREVKVRRAC